MEHCLPDMIGDGIYEIMRTTCLLLCFMTEPLSHSQLPGWHFDRSYLIKSRIAAEVFKGA